jgi:hypothetical protein
MYQQLTVQGALVIALAALRPTATMDILTTKPPRQMAVAHNALIECIGDRFDRMTKLEQEDTCRQLIKSLRRSYAMPASYPMKD